MANAMEIGARLQAMADEVVRAINEKKELIAGHLADALAMVAEMEDVATSPVNEVCEMLDEQHPAAQAIIGNTGNVQEATEKIEAAIAAAVQTIEDAAAGINQLGFVYTNVGESIMKAGGA